MLTCSSRERLERVGRPREPTYSTSLPPAQQAGKSRCSNNSLPLPPRTSPFGQRSEIAIMSTQVPPAAGVASRQPRNPRRSEYDRHQAQVHGSEPRSGRGERERERTGEGGVGVAGDEARAGAGAGGRSMGSGNRSRSITAPGDGDARNSGRKEKDKTAAELVK